MSPTAVLESTEWPSFVCSSLAMLRQEGVLCDTTILGKNGRTLLAHSCILAAASPVLRTIVTQQNLVSFLHKTDFISRGVWDVILEFIYQGKVTIETVTDAHDIMVAAEKLELEKLRSLCEDFLHIEGAILKDRVTAIVLNEKSHTDVPVIKTELGLSPQPSIAQNVQTEIDSASYGSVMPPTMLQSSNPEVSTSVRIKTEPIDDVFDKQSTSDSVLTSGDGSGQVLSGSLYQKDKGYPITNQPMQTDVAVYPFITHAAPLVSSSMPVSHPMGSMHEWSTAPMATDLSRGVPVTIPLTIPVIHKLPIILPNTAEATEVSNNITRRLPLTRALLSTGQTLTASNSAPQLARSVGDTALTTQLSPSDGHDDLPALVTVNHTNVTNSAVTTGCRLDTCGQSVTYSSAMATSNMPVSSTVEDEGPLCLVMPKKKPVVKTRRKRRPVAVRPQVPPMSNPADPPSFQTPVTLQHPTTEAYPTSISGQYQQPSGPQLPKRPPPGTDLCPPITPYEVWSNSELRRRLASRQSAGLGTVTSLGAVDVSLDDTTGQMSPSSIAQAEVPAAAMPRHVAPSDEAMPCHVAAPSDEAMPRHVAPSDEASEKTSEGRSVEEQRAKEQIAIEVISQLSGAYKMGRGRRKKTTTLKRRHPNHNGFLPSQKGPKLTIKLKTPKRQSFCSLSPEEFCMEIPESVLEQNDSGQQRCNVVLYDTTAVESGATLGSMSHDSSTCLPTTVIDADQLTVRNVMKLHSSRMSEERQLMRPWLEMQLGANTVPGLHWMNEAKTLARIPWLHASRTSYQMDTDSCLFMMWAEHTGKYVPSRDEPDPKRWKANFRCALNSLADVLEVKDSSQKRGREAFKVYEFLPHTKKSRRHGTPHANSGRRKKEDASSSGGETDGVKMARRRLVSPGPSDTPSKRLTGRDIMSVMRRKGGVIDGDMSVEDSVSATAVAVAAAVVSAVQCQHNSDITLKPDSTSSTIPSPDLDAGAREVGNVPASVSPSEPTLGSQIPGSKTAMADTSTHCIVDTDTHKTLASTALWADQPLKQHTTPPPPGMRAAHTGFSCKECSQWFTHSTMLASHQLSHTTSVKAYRDTAGLGCMAGGMGLAMGNPVMEQKPTET